MLSLQQKVNDWVYIFDEEGEQILRMTVIKVQGYSAKIGIECDKKYTILRDKVLKRKIENGEPILNKNKGVSFESIGNVRDPDEEIFFTDNINDE